MAIYLIRHTTPDISLDTCYGHTDVDVVVDFAELSNRIAKHLNGFNPKYIFSSTLQRCSKLAKHLFKDDGIIYDDRLKEMNFGNWEGVKWIEIKRSELHEWSKDFVNYRVPGGESFKAFAERVDSLWNEMDKTKDVVWVTHAGVFRIILSKALEITPRKVFSIQLKYGQVIKLQPVGEENFSIEFL